MTGDHGYGDGLEGTPALEEIGTAGGTHFKVATKAVIDQEIRCTGKVEDRVTHESKLCGRLLAECAARPWRIRCGRCKQVNRSPADSDLSLTHG